MEPKTAFIFSKLMEMIMRMKGLDEEAGGDNDGCNDIDYDMTTRPAGSDGGDRCEDEY